jgi:hypothetical protein
MSCNLSIGLKLNIDSATGVPFIQSDNGRHITFNINSLTVPTPFKKFISQTGPWFREYIKAYDTDWEFEASAKDFLQNYPIWTLVYEGLEDNYSWTEKDHDSFKNALTWFVEKGCFYLHWSY